MTIVVEDGTMMDLASPLPNSYASVNDFIEWAELRGHTTQAEADDEQIEAALIRAVDYMTQKWRHRLKGSRVRGFQPLDWPRRGVDVPDFFDPFFKQVNVPISFQDTLFIAENVVPVEVKEVQLQLTFHAFSGALATGVLQPNLGRATKREKLGTLEVEYFNAEDGSTRQTTVYWDAEQRLQPFLLPSSANTGRLVRS